MTAAHRVLLTAVGTQTSYSAAAAVRGPLERDENRHYLLGADTNPRKWIAASPLLNEFVQAPAASDERFADWLLSTVARYDIDTYFPVIDAEIRIAASLVESGQLRAAHVIAPPAQSAAIAYDKWDAFKVFSAAGIPTPECWLDATRIDVAIKRVLVKPRGGFGSRGVRITDTHGVHLADGEMAQQLCVGPEITVDAFHDARSNTVRVLARERVEVKAGICTKARIHESAELLALTRQLLAVWPYEGSFCFQVMRDAGDDAWQIIDLNARPGGGTAMSAAVDNDFFSAHFLRAWNEDTAGCFTSLVQDKFVVRRHLEVVTA